MPDKVPTAGMIRAARVLLGLSQDDLAGIADVTRWTVMRVEADDEVPTNPRRIAVCSAIRNGLEKEGIRFLYPGAAHGGGVVLKKSRR